MRERCIPKDEFRRLLAAGLIRPATLDDVQGTHHQRPLFRHPNTGQWYTYTTVKEAK